MTFFLIFISIRELLLQKLKAKKVRCKWSTLIKKKMEVTFYSQFFVAILTEICTNYYQGEIQKKSRYACFYGWSLFLYISSCLLRKEILCWLEEWSFSMDGFSVSSLPNTCIWSGSDCSPSNTNPIVQFIKYFFHLIGLFRPPKLYIS